MRLVLLNWITIICDAFCLLHHLTLAYCENVSKEIPRLLNVQGCWTGSTSRAIKFTVSPDQSINIVVSFISIYVSNQIIY